MQNEKEERIKEFVERKGPVLPVDIAKEMNIETYLASAVLSTLINKGGVKISFRKVGSSPLYFCPGQESRVRDILYKELNDMEKKVLERIKQLRVAFKDDLYPQERFLLNELKDFVSHLQVVPEGSRDSNPIFCWKHHSVNAEEFESVIKSKMGTVDEKKEIEPQQEPIQSDEIPEKPIVEKEEKPEEQIQPKPDKPQKRIKRRTSQSEFEKIVLERIKNVGEVLSVNSLRGGMRVLISMDTSVGKQRVIVVAKNKSSITENDISRIYIEEQKNKMPVIILVQKEPSKKLFKYVQDNMGEFLKFLKI